MTALLAALTAFDALFCAFRLHSYWIAPFAVVAAILFAWRKSLLAGLVLLVATGVLVESLPEHERFLFFSGSCLAGFLFASLVDRRLGETGAVSALAATYLGAFFGKLMTPDWSSGIGPVIAAQHVWGHHFDSLAQAILDHSSFARALGIFTLIAQASAILMPFSRRGRAFSCTLLLIFHIGVWLLTPILFPQAMILLVAFGYRALPDVPSIPRQNLLRATALTVVVVGLAWLPPVRAFGHRVLLAGGDPPSPESRAFLGRVVEGAPIGDYRVVQIDQLDDTIRLRLERGLESIIVELVPHGARPFRPPLTVRDRDLFVQGDPSVIPVLAGELR
jgi:hypothetical protein